MKTSFSHRESTREYWDKLAVNYNSSLASKLIPPFIPTLISHMDLSKRQNAKVLDLGVGTGFATLHLSQLPNIAELYCVDISKEMLSQLLQQLKRIKSFPKIHVLQQSAEQLEFPNEYFDCILSSFVIMYVSDRYKVYKEIHRVLKTGGIAVISVWNRPENLEPNSFIDSIICKMFGKEFLLDCPEFCLSDVNQFCAELLKVGQFRVRVKVVEKEIIDWCFERTEFEEYAWKRASKCVPLELKEVFLSEIRKCFQKQKIIWKTCSNVAIVQKM